MSALGDAIARYDQSKQAYENKAGAYLRNRNLTLSAQNPGGIQVRTATPANTAPTFTTRTPKVTIQAVSDSDALPYTIGSDGKYKLPNGFTRLIEMITGTKKQKEQLAQAEAYNTKLRYENPTAADAAATNFYNSTSLGVAGTNPQYQQQLSLDQKSHPIASVAGNLAGFLIPSDLAEKGVSYAARPLLERMGTSVAAKIAKPVITSAASQGALAGVSDLLQRRPVKEVAKDTAINAAFSGALAGIGSGGGQIPAVQKAGAYVREKAGKYLRGLLGTEKKGGAEAAQEANDTLLANGLRAEKGGPADLLRAKATVSAAAEPAAENTVTLASGLKAEKGSPAALLAEHSKLSEENGFPYRAQNADYEIVQIPKAKIDELTDYVNRTQQTQIRSEYRKILKELYGGSATEAKGITVNGNPYSVSISGSGISEALKQKKTPELLAVMGKLDNIIKEGKFMSSEPDKRLRPEILRSDILKTDVKLGDQPAEAITRVNSTNEGNKFYYLRVKKAEPISTSPRPGIDPARGVAAENSTNSIVSQFTKNTSGAAEKAGAGEGIATPEKLLETRDQIDKLERARDNYDAKYMLTLDEKAMADDIARGRRTAESLPPDARRETIMQAAANRKALNDSRQVLEDYNTARRKASDDQMQDILKTSDGMKDKSKLAYGRETLDRNIEDIAPNSEEGNRLRETLVDPIHEHEAQRIRFENQGRQMARSLNLSKKESEVVQKVGEGVLEPVKIPVGMDRQKIINAVGVLRKWYNDTFDAVNEKLVQYGYEPVKYRKDYFPHFDGHDELLDKIKSVFGIDLTNYDLPTEINGLTHNFKPGKQWFGNFLQRSGDKTTYDAVAGFDKYIDGVSRVLYHTDDIQRLRAFARNIRYKYSDENLQKEYGKIIGSDLPQADKDKKIEDLFEKGPTHLSNFVADLEDYIQVLAGKKSLSDRSIENTFGRKVYSVANNIEQRISRNMVAINPGSWLTNFIPLTQATAGNDTSSVLRAMADTVKSVFGDDGFVGKSTFLTNRVGSDPLRKGIIEKATEIGAAPMRWIDEFTSQVITRAKYYDEVKRGVDAATAMKDADRWAARAIGDRSIGSQPTLFNSKNPITRLFTQFQLETNNQLSFLFKDLPKSLQGHAASKYASTIVKLALFSYLYNEGYQALTGRRLDIDPIGMGLGIYNDVSGERLPVQLDYWAKGSKMPKQSGTATLKNLDEMVANNIPFIAAPAAALGIEDLGRLPISGAIPNTSNIYTAVSQNGMTPTTLSKVGPELLKPIYYGALPFGGGQLKKTIEGVGAVNAGGDFANTSSGKTLKYAVDKTPQNYLQAALFGKWSLPQAQDYISSGGLSAKRTQAWQDAVKKGADNEKAFAALKSLSEIQPAQGHKSVTTDQYIDALIYMKGLTDNQKIAVANTVLESETAREKFLKRLYQ